MSEVALGLGYVELQMKDRGVANTLTGVQQQLVRTASSAEQFSVRTRSAVNAASASIQGMGAAAAAGVSPLRSMAGGMAGLGAAMGGVAGPAGAVAALVTTIVGLGLSRWLKDSAEGADALARSLDAARAAGERARDASTAMMAGGGALPAVQKGADIIGRVASAAKARADAGGRWFRSSDEMDAADAGFVQASAHAEQWREMVQREFSKLMLGAAEQDPRVLAQREGVPTSPGTAVTMQSQRVRMLEQARDIARAAAGAEDPSAHGSRYEQFVNYLGRSQADLEEATRLLEGYKRSLDEAMKAAEEMRDRSEAAMRAVHEGAREMAEAFEQASKAAAGTRGELKAAEDRAADIRSQRLYGAQEMAKPAARIVGGRTIDLMSGLRSIQESVFGSGDGSHEAQTAKATKETAEAAKRQLEEQKEANRNLKAILKEMPGVGTLA